MKENECLLDPPSKTTVTIYKHDTVYGADSVEWCPHKPYSNFFVCGTYELIEAESKNSKRLGGILLFSVDINHGLQLQQTIETAAVLDLKWCPNSTLLGVVNAKGSVEIYELQEGKLKFLSKYTFIEGETETLVLSLDWSSGKFESQHPHITCSDSEGNIHLLQLVDQELVLKKSWHAHKFQAWISGFYYWDTNIIFSGGDDNMFLKFDQRCGVLPMVKNKQHEAGVTSFHSNKSREFLVASGSYDEKVRLWDMRSLKCPLSELKMSGPLWRLKWDPFFQKYLLAACMLKGAHIIVCNKSAGVSIHDSYYEHKNITYGVDWSFLEPQEVSEFPEEGNVMFSSCSFYDHLLCVGKVVCDFSSKDIS